MAKVILLCGPVGSGKSFCAQQYKARGNTVVLSCDDLMLTLFDSCIGPVRHQDMLRRCKTFLFSQAEEFYSLGLDVVLDFGFWSRNERKETKAYFTAKGIPVYLCYIKTSDAVITNHLAKRNAAVEAGLTRAYHIDSEKRARFNAQFEVPLPEEIDILKEITE